MATPTYNGNAQPNVNGGWFGGLGSLYGSNSPSYAPAPTKAKAPAATAQQPTGSSAAVQGTCDGDRITLIIPRDLIASGQLTADGSQDSDDSSDSERLTLVIPRSLLTSSQT